MSPQPFPHLQRGEAMLWFAWLQAHAAEYDRFDYDVRVGEGVPIDPAWPPYIQAMARIVSKKRIDAVGYKGAAPTLFIIMRTARRAAAGAFYLYPRLYRRTFRYDGPIGCAIVTHLIDLDVRLEVEADGCQVFLLPAPETVP